VKITVDENGNVEPVGAADLLATVNEFTTLTEGQPVSDKAEVRTFQCASCNQAFEARAGRVSIHECKFQAT
jgi:hypothetical protein